MKSIRYALIAALCLITLIASEGAAMPPRSGTISSTNISRFFLLSGRLNLACYRNSTAVFRLSSKKLKLGISFHLVNVRAEIKQCENKIRTPTALPAILATKRGRRLRAKIAELREAKAACRQYKKDYGQGVCESSSCRSSSAVNSSDAPSSPSGSSISSASSNSRSSTVHDGTMSTANRTLCTAPCAVFFDAVDTTEPRWKSGVIQPPDGDFAPFHYEWEFDDPESGNWTNGRQNADGSNPSKSRAVGYVAGHVFEQPNTYGVTLKVTTPSKTYYYRQDVQVELFSGTTYYVSDQAGADNNDGLSEATPLKTFAKVVSKITGSNVRALFKRGDTFRHSGAIGASASGVILGAYGQGVRPVIESDVADDGFFFDISGDDIRIADLEFKNTSPAPKEGATWFGSVGNFHLFLRLKATGWRIGFGLDDDNPNPYDGNAVVECEADMAGYPASYGFYGGGKHLIFLGNRLTGSTSHGSRFVQAHKAIISNNSINKNGPGNGRPAITLRGCLWNESGPRTNQFVPTCPATDTYAVIISDNDLISDSVGVSVSTSHLIDEDGTRHPMIFREFLIERNSFRPIQSGFDEFGNPIIGYAAVVSEHRKGIIRNNLINWTGGGYATGIGCGQAADSPIACGDLQIYHNLITRMDPYISGQNLHLLSIGDPGRTIVKNNLLYAPNIIKRWDLRGLCNDGTEFGTAACNKLETGGNIDTSTSSFINPAGGNFHLQSNSPARDAGVPAPVYEDFDGHPRPQGPGYDIGVYE